MRLIAQMKLITIATLAALISGCGMTQAVRTSAEGFDRAECLSREFRGEEPCPDTTAFR